MSQPNISRPENTRSGTTLSNIARAASLVQQQSALSAAPVNVSTKAQPAQHTAPSQESALSPKPAAMPDLISENSITPAPIAEASRMSEPETFIIDGTAYSLYPGPIVPHWQQMAAQKGFAVLARIRDRYHLALRCHTCAAVSMSKLFTLRTAHPQCPRCLERKREESAKAAGLAYLGPMPAKPGYFHFRGRCGHAFSRQFELIHRVGAGETGLRCETCHAAREAEEAHAQGWELLGPDPDGNPNYRLYAHVCGHRQRVARANMQTGRFACGSCDPGWAASPSALYAMRFDLPGFARPVVKLGFSRDPRSRLDHQLQRKQGRCGTLLAEVQMRTGRSAMRAEKRLHARLRREYPGAVIDPARFQGLIRVGSEIYDGALEGVILGALERIAVAQRKAKNGTHRRSRKVAANSDRE
ncbi:MAG: GIY-YIG nuclease family protein [Paracoccus sp. (in: a-proteobacteria)]|nr:GIY-YIG nuclease family protein [Paracoccus sp. (in: a-proteobacteria)]